MADPTPGGVAALAELTGVEKVYPNGVIALRGVDLRLGTGEVHAIVGENGAGKSTLVKILFGLEAPTAGEIRLAGRSVTRHSPAAAMAAGIGMVHQHFQLVPSLTVAENLVLGQEPRRGPFLDGAAATETVTRLTETLGIDLDPQMRVSDLPVGDQQRLEILKALHRGARILILDEPSAVLTPQETDKLLESVRRLAANGTGVVLITHKLREVMQAADVVTVLRSGERVWTKPRPGLTVDGIAAAMVGAAVTPVVTEPGGAPGATVLTLRDIRTGGPGRGRLRGIDLDIGAGEILGVAGVEGNGQDDLVDVIAGLRPAASGTITLDGHPITTLSPRRRRGRGLSHVAADRMHRGVAPTASLFENLAAIDIAVERDLPHGERARTAATVAIDRYGILSSGPGVPVGALSGGNVQKVMVARELKGSPRVVLAAHPTRGVDLGAMARIHQAILERRASGAGVLLVSSELDELRALSDRLVVLHDGEIVARHDDLSGVTDTELGVAMAGSVDGDTAAAPMLPEDGSTGAEG